MRIAITADLHLNNNTYQVIDPDSGLYIKSVDAINAFEWFAQQAVEKKVDRVVIIGDIYHNSDPTEAIRRRVSPVLQMLASHGIQVVILTGNHDFCSKYHALESLNGWNNLVKILDEPFYETGVATYVPHTIGIECERINFRDVIGAMPSSGSGGHVFFGHFAVRGAMRDNLSREESGGAVSTTDIEGIGATIAFLGHFHKFQRVKSNIPVFYVGSIENHRMDDMDGKRGFIVYDTGSGEYERVDYDNCRPMHSIDVESPDSAALLFQDGDWQSSVVRLTVVGEHSDFIGVRNSMPEIKRLFAAAGGAYIYCLDKTGVRDKIRSKIEIKSIEQIDPIAVLRAEVDERLKNDDEERSVTRSILDEIYVEECTK